MAYRRIKPFSTNNKLCLHQNSVKKKAVFAYIEADKRAKIDNCQRVRIYSHCITPRYRFKSCRQVKCKQALSCSGYSFIKGFSPENADNAACFFKSKKHP